MKKLLPKIVQKFSTYTRVYTVPICYDRNIIARNIHLAFAHENCFETKIGQINKNQQIRMMDEFCSKTHEKWKMEATITIKSCFNVQK